MKKNKKMIRGIDYIGVGVGALIINKQGKIFLAKRGNNTKNERGKWECPGGSVEFGDTLEETIIREMEEEYGFKVKPVELLSVCDHILPKENQHWVSPSYICRVAKGTPKIMEPDKCDEIGWFTREEVRSMDISEASKDNFVSLDRKYPKRLPSLY